MRYSKGVALITVMLVVALVAILATQMLAKLQLQVQRASNIEYNQQAYWYAMGAEAFAKRVLLTSIEEEKDKTHLKQVWAQGENTYPVDFGEITGEISDLHACLNLNALKDESTISAGTVKKSVARTAFEKLVVLLSIEGVSEFEAEYMADALTDWLDSNSSIVSAGGAEDNDYAAKEFPYLPGNNYLASVNELRIIEHFTIPVINALKPYVCVLPNSEMHKININTLTTDNIELLAALLDIENETAEQIISAREDEGFDDIEQVFSLPELSSETISDEQKQQFVVNSEYFKLTAHTTFNSSHFYFNSILQVANNNKINVISRTIGRE